MDIFINCILYFVFIMIAAYCISIPIGFIIGQPVEIPSLGEISKALIIIFLTAFLFSIFYYNINNGLGEILTLPLMIGIVFGPLIYYLIMINND